MPLSVKLEEANDLVFRINHSESRFVVVSGFQVAKIRAIKDKTPALESVIVFDEFEGIEEPLMAIEQGLANLKRLAL